MGDMFDKYIHVRIENRGLKTSRSWDSLKMSWDLVLRLSQDCIEMSWDSLNTTRSQDVFKTFDFISHVRMFQWNYQKCDSYEYVSTTLALLIIEQPLRVHFLFHTSMMGYPSNVFASPPKSGSHGLVGW
jgi:hypothetical protein